MSPKTGLNDKKSNLKTKNQLSNNNEINQNSTLHPIELDKKESNQLSDTEELNQNSTTESIKLDNELKFKLNFDIRDKLIAILNDYTSLLYGDKNKEKVIEKSNDLMHNFVDLPLKEDEIKENVIDSIEPLKPTLIINSKMKTEITDLLIKNKNYFISFKNNKAVKLNLINKNNNLVIKLMQFPIEMLKEDDPIDNDYVWKRVLIDKSNHTVDDLLMVKSKSDEEIANYKNEILELKEKISKSNALPTNQKESITHFFEIKQFYSFLLQKSGEIKSLPFECSDLDFIIIIQNLDSHFYFELAILNKVDIYKKVKITCELILINNNKTSDKENMSLNLDLVFTQNQLFKSKEKVNKYLPNNFTGEMNDFISKYIHNKTLKMKVNLTAELIKLVD